MLVVGGRALDPVLRAAGVAAARADPAPPTDTAAPAEGNPMTVLTLVRSELRRLTATRLATSRSSR